MIKWIHAAAVQCPPSVVQTSRIFPRFVLGHDGVELWPVVVVKLYGSTYSLMGMFSTIGQLNSGLCCHLGLLELLKMRNSALPAEYHRESRILNMVNISWSRRVNLQLR